MKLYKTLLIAAFSLSLSAPGYAQDGYLVILKSFATTPTLKQGQAIEKQFSQLRAQGFAPYVIKTDDYPPLRKGLWAMVLGEFDKQTATEKQTQVKTWVSDAYLRKVQLPKVHAIDDQFSAVDTYFNNKKDCFSVEQALEQEGYGKDFCIGKQGYAVDIAYGDARAFVNINGKDFQGENWLGSDGFPFVISEYPLTWIYRNDNLRQPIAVSLVISTTDVDGNNHNDRYLIKINGKNLTPVKQKFPIKGGLDSLAEYFAKSMDYFTVKETDTATTRLQASFDAVLKDYQNNAAKFKKSSLVAMCKQPTDEFKHIASTLNKMIAYYYDFRYLLDGIDAYPYGKDDKALQTIGTIDKYINALTAEQMQMMANAVLDSLSTEDKLSVKVLLQALQESYTQFHNIITPEKEKLLTIALKDNASNANIFYELGIPKKSGCYNEYYSFDGFPVKMKSEEASFASYSLDFQLYSFWWRRHQAGTTEKIQQLLDNALHQLKDIATPDKYIDNTTR